MALQDQETYREFFRSLTDHDPYDYQVELAECERLPDVLLVPTGGGKTDAVIVQWLWRLLADPANTPHRLAYCLPMRVLVDQTMARVHEILHRYAEHEHVPPASCVLMGGIVPEPWEEDVVSPQILVGTQDMMISRALNQGYGMGYYRRPVDFGLLNADTLWVLDEIQLMGPALRTSVQLQAFRVSDRSIGHCSTLWMSATTSRDWFTTMDSRSLFGPDGLRVIKAGFTGSLLDTGDESRLRQLSTAEKPVSVLESVILQKRSETSSYVSFLAEHILCHRAGPTIVVVNSVDRAIRLYQRIQERLDIAGNKTEILLLHSRFRGYERAGQQSRLKQLMDDQKDCIVVSTQVIEAGVDISCRTLYTELAPLSSLVQRFGRCNRRNEYRDKTPARVYIVPIDGTLEPSVCLPYYWHSLEHARTIVGDMTDVSPSGLASLDFDQIEGPVLDRAQFARFVMSEEDVNGNIDDPSQFIRTKSDEADVRLFWRDLEETAPESQLPPVPNELCSVPLKKASAYVLRVLEGLDATHPNRWPWVFDEEHHVWRQLTEGDPNTLVKYQIVMLPCAAGGYSGKFGFVPRLLTGPVNPVAPAMETKEHKAHRHGCNVELLADHLEKTWSVAVATTAQLAGIDGCDDSMLRAIRGAALVHDVGKADRRFQAALGNNRQDVLLAKAASMDWRELQGLRHELESDIYMSSRSLRVNAVGRTTSIGEFTDTEGAWKGLARYLVRAHHGRIRRTLPIAAISTGSGGDRVMGIYPGMIGPPIKIQTASWLIESPGVVVTKGDIDDMERELRMEYRDLVKAYGVFRLGYAEAVLRVMDWRASSGEGEQVWTGKEDA